MDYKPQDIEPKWRSYWEENNTYKVTEDQSRPKYYVLDMFPYPSGAGLHVGHPLGYIASDIFSRFKRMKGFNVLHPMGFDSFGLPAEEYAIQTGIHPRKSTEENMARYREQLSKLGFSYDWDRAIYTSDPNYYKWTQWIFTLLYDHYYDRATESAKPIEHLISTFVESGNTKVNAAQDEVSSFSAADWTSMTEKEQDDILMSYRLAFKKVGYVNWCEELGTVLANDQVVNGVSNRGGYPVVQKAMTQWYLRITAYADRLLYGLDKIDWSESLKTIQRNWIGRSEGAKIRFELDGHDEHIEIFTTRPDTIFGATYLVLAPEHDLVAQITTDDQREAVNDYVAYVKSKSEIDRMAEKSVTGVHTGAYAIHPITKSKIPVWIGEYVLKDYGTGAIMAVPSDDERDQRFAQKFGLEIIDVVDKSAYPDSSLKDKEGVMINSDFLNGMQVPEAISEMCSRVEELGVGNAKVNYKMRDANFSRQRYWGEPFPIKYDEQGIAHMIDIDSLPVTLPDTDDFKPRAGASPLERMTDWMQIDDEYTRESDVMPAVAGSSWYFLRYMDPHNSDAFASKESINYWQDVDLYLGGSEHAVAHLMYARFWHKFLHDLGYLPTDEPFKKLFNQGMIQGEIEHILLKKNSDSPKEFVCRTLISDEDLDQYSMPYVHIQWVKNYGKSDKISYLDEEGIVEFLKWRKFDHASLQTKDGTYTFKNYSVVGDPMPEHWSIATHTETGKMSKSRYNVINPDDVISRYGTDCFRMFEMFLGPLDQSKPWNTQGIDGVSKFIKRFWSLFHDDNYEWNISDENASKAELKVLHETIKKVSSDIEQLAMNTAVSSFMICVNGLKKLKCDKRAILEPLTKLLAPFAPFITEELWKKLGHANSIHHSDYPTHDEQYLVEDEVEYPLCINGKKKSSVSLAADLSIPDIQKLVPELEETKRILQEKDIKKLIVVPGRMINIVV